MAAAPRPPRHGATCPPRTRCGLLPCGQGSRRLWRGVGPAHYWPSCGTRPHCRSRPASSRGIADSRDAFPSWRTMQDVDHVRHRRSATPAQARCRPARPHGERCRLGGSGCRHHRPARADIPGGSCLVSGRHGGCLEGAVEASEKEDRMQVGMIGLGRMGANMARRLMHGGHVGWVLATSPVFGGLGRPSELLRSPRWRLDHLGGHCATRWRPMWGASAGNRPGGGRGCGPGDTDRRISATAVAQGTRRPLGMGTNHCGAGGLPRRAAVRPRRVRFTRQRSGARGRGRPNGE